MIRITVELVSARDAKRDRLLGVAYLANTGVMSGLGYNYHVWLSKTLPGKTGQAWQTGRAAIADDAELLAGPPDDTVDGFDNKRRGAWDLIYLALKQVIGRRNP